MSTSTEKMEIKLPETLMDKSITFDLSEEEKKEIKTEMAELLQKFGYKYPSSAFVITDTWVKENGWMLKLFSKHPNYIKGKFMFVIEPELKRFTDKEAIKKFHRWFDRQLFIFEENHQAKIGFFNLYEYSEIRNHFYDKYKKLEGFLELYDFGNFKKDNYYFLIKNIREKFFKEYDRMSKVLCDAKQDAVSTDSFILPKEIGIKCIQVKTLIDFVLDDSYITSENQTPHLFNKEEIDRIKHYFNSQKNKRSEITFVRLPQVGEKKTRFVLKLAKVLDINKVTDIKKKKWTDQSGIEHSRTVDEGWNKQFAEFSDAITPRTYKEKIIVSANLIDYYTMSFLNDTSSCMTIDKENRRGSSDSMHVYHGMYSSGTESYMLDNSSFVVYHPSESIEGEENLPYELKTKQWRCMFHMGEDKLIQGRLYPNGRNDSDNGTDDSKSLYDQIREIVQREIAMLLETPNLWLNKKGTGHCSSVVSNIGNHYKDYTQYRECNVSYLRRIDGLLNENLITIGHKTICPVCGIEHEGHPGYNNDNIQCDDCMGQHECQRCGCIVDIYDSYALEIDGNYYCCESCAENDGYVHTEDAGWQSEDDCIYDDYEEIWYYNTDNGIDIGDEWYHNEDSARNAGYVYCDLDDEWEYHCDVEETPEGFLFSTAINDGYVEGVDANGNHVYFPDKEYANAYGWHFNEEEDCWYKD